MGVTDRRVRHRTLLRQQILDAARDLLVHEGYENLSMRRVAQRIDYSPTAIYLHFKDKQELIVNLCEETFARLVKELVTLTDEFPDPLVRLRKGMERYVNFGLAHPDHYIPAFMLPQPEEVAAKPGEEIMTESGMRALTILRDSIADGVRAGKLRPVDPDVAARSTWAALHGITSLLIAHPCFPWGDRQQVIDNLLDTAMDGLRRR